MLALVTLGLHALLLDGSRFGAESAPLPSAVQVAAVQVRSVATAPVEDPAPAGVLPAPALLPVAVPAPVAPAPAAPKPRQPRAEPVVAMATTADPPPAPIETPLPQEPLLAAVDAPAALPVPGDTDVPTYRTRLAPPATLRYELRRGILSGTGELRWKPAADHYELQLEGSIAGISVLLQTSTGGIDEAGIAPMRFVDQRRRDIRAANFQRDKGRITFSGPAVEYPLVPGAQDRLSWMIQLGAVVNAEPQRATPGGRVAMFIVGARGDGDVWVFRFVATETVATGAGTVHAVKFTREPRRPYDTFVEVWLDPQRHHLPVHARLSTAPDGGIFELLLRDMQ
jgi:hypothetical protein